MKVEEGVCVCVCVRVCVCVCVYGGGGGGGTDLFVLPVCEIVCAIKILLLLHIFSNIANTPNQVHMWGGVDILLALYTSGTAEVERPVPNI